MTRALCNTIHKFCLPLQALVSAAKCQAKSLLNKKLEIYEGEGNSHTKLAQFP